MLTHVARTRLWERLGGPLALAALVVVGAVVCVFALSRSPYALLAAPALLISAVACSRRPAAAVICVFALTGTYGSVTAFTPFPVGGAIDLVLAGLWLGALWGFLFGTDERPRWLWPGVLLMVGYLALTAFEVLAGDDVETGLYSFRAGGWYIAAFLLIAFAPWPEGSDRRIANGILVTGLLVGGYAAVRYVTGPATAELDLALERTDNPDFISFVGSLTSNKELAAWCAGFLPFAFALALLRHGRWRLVAAAATVLCGFTLVAADSRLQLLAAVGGIGLVLALHHFARATAGIRLGTTATALIALALVGSAAFGLATGFSQESTERYTSIADPLQVRSVQERLHTWRSVLEEIEEQPLGHGLGTAGGIHHRFGRFATIGGESIDSAYLKVGLEQGWAGMASFALALLALLWGLGSRAVTTPNSVAAEEGIGASGALLVLLVLGVGGIYIDGFTALAVWIAVGVALRGLSRRGRPTRPSGSVQGKQRWAVAT